MNPESLKPLLQRDQVFLEELYASPSVTNSRRLLNFASDQKLSTLAKVLHFIAIGEIKLKRQHFDSLASKTVRNLHKHFETKAACRRILNSERAQKLRLLNIVACNFHELLYPLFNES